MKKLTIIIISICTVMGIYTFAKSNRYYIKNDYYIDGQAIIEDYSKIHECFKIKFIKRNNIPKNIFEKVVIWQILFFIMCLKLKNIKSLLMES